MMGREEKNEILPEPELVVNLKDILNNDAKYNKRDHYKYDMPLMEVYKRRNKDKLGNENDSSVEAKELSTSMNQDIMQNCDSTTENSNIQTPIKGGLEKVIDISDYVYSTNKKTVEDQIKTKRSLDNIYDISDLQCSTSKKHIVVKKEKEPIIN
ncbi:unnamed protein product [Amaranthus hypochondriacus]